MLISARNKNPLINFERKDWKNQNPQIFIGSTFSLKCMKHENKWKKRGKKVLSALEDKNPWRNLRENDKNSDLKPWPIEEREKSVLKKFESDWTREKNFLKKTLYTIFDWSKVRFDRSKVPSIDPEPIEQQSNWSDSNQNFNHIFDWSKTYSIDWKSGKHNFWKTWQFYAKTPQSIVFYE